MAFCFKLLHSMNTSIICIGKCMTIVGGFIVIINFFTQKISP